MDRLGELARSEAMARATEAMAEDLDMAVGKGTN